MQTQTTENPAKRLAGAAVSALTVGDMMSTDLFTALPDDSIQTLKDVMDWRSIRHVPIVDDGGRLLGLVSQRDILRISVSALAGIDRQEAERLYRGIPLAEVMGRNVKTVRADATLAEAASLMVEHKFGCLPVVDSDRKLVGILTESDFVRCFAG